jgi:hypothetical protein
VELCINQILNKVEVCINQSLNQVELCINQIPESSGILYKPNLQ